MSEDKRFADIEPGDLSRKAKRENKALLRWILTKIKIERLKERWERIKKEREKDGNT